MAETPKQEPHKSKYFGGQQNSRKRCRVCCGDAGPFIERCLATGNSYPRQHVPHCTKDGRSVLIPMPAGTGQFLALASLHALVLPMLNRPCWCGGCVSKNIMVLGLFSTVLLNSTFASQFVASWAYIYGTSTVEPILAAYKCFK